MKLGLFVLLAFLLELSAHAQSRWLKGAQLYGGANLSSDAYLYAGRDTDHRGRDTGLGLIIGRRLGSYSRFTLMSGLNFIHRSYSSSWERMLLDKPVFGQTNAKINYLEAPLTLKYRFRKLNRVWSPFVQAGLFFSIETSNKAVFNRSDGLVRHYPDVYFPNLTVGNVVGVGAEFRVTRRMHLTIQPVGSLTSILLLDTPYALDTFYGLSLGVYYW
ncbi:MAG: PorT family protein [Bernardetiaceae bacterium]|jgi:hypothetical protein|nr:PorT family protein [Bernardetiaceae bacterium]